MCKLVRYLHISKVTHSFPTCNQSFLATNSHSPVHGNAPARRKTHVLFITVTQHLVCFREKQDQCALSGRDSRRNARANPDGSRFITARFPRAGPFSGPCTVFTTSLVTPRRSMHTAAETMVGGRSNRIPRIPLPPEESFLFFLSLFLSLAPLIFSPLLFKVSRVDITIQRRGGSLSQQKCFFLSRLIISPRLPWACWRRRRSWHYPSPSSPSPPSSQMQRN